MVNTLAVLWMVTADVPDAVLVAYAAGLPIFFRLLIIASDHTEPSQMFRSLQVWRAMRRGEIVLHYQPKVLIGSDDLQGVEALARWEHPRRGVLPPAEWLAATEHRWLVLPFCRYVLSAAVRQAVQWRERG